MICEKCFKELSQSDEIFIDDDGVFIHVCTDCAVDTLLNPDIMENIGKYLKLQDIRNLKLTSPAFVKPDIKPILDKFAQEKYIEECKDAFDIYLQQRPEPYRKDAAFHILGSTDWNTEATEENFLSEEYRENSVKYLREKSDFSITEFLDDDAIVDEDGNEFSSAEDFFVYYYGEHLVDEMKQFEKDIKEGKTIPSVGDHGIIPNELFDLYEFVLQQSLVDSNKNQLLEDAYMYRVRKTVENDNTIMPGDVFWHETIRYPDRPIYGLGLVGWDCRTNKKVALEDGEGNPSFSDLVTNKIISNKITYINANKEVISTLFPDLEGELTYDGEINWILPSICKIITNAVNQDS